MTELRESLERRRLQAVELFRQGLRQSDVARRLGVSRTTAHRWAEKLASHGSLRATVTLGRPSRLTAEQLIELEAAITRNPYISAPDVQEFIRLKWGIRYHRDHALRLRNFLLGRTDRLGGTVSHIGQKV